jgi:hypothetical protein
LQCGVHIAALELSDRRGAYHEKEAKTRPEFAKFISRIWKFFNVKTDEISVRFTFVSNNIT